MNVHDMEDLGENYVGYDDEVSRIDRLAQRILEWAGGLKPDML